MRNPNGYGGIIKLSGKRRKPYMVRITDHWEDDKQIFKPLGYYAKRKDAVEALAAYNNTGKTESATITFEEIYNLWSGQQYPKLKPSNIAGYKAAYKYCEPIKDKRMVDIKTADLQSIIDGCEKGYSTKQKIKGLLSQVYSYAGANDIFEKDYSQFVSGGSKDDKLLHVPFSTQELDKLWANLDKYEWLDTVLIQIYTGLRIGELLAIKMENVHVEEKYMRGGLKTTAGKNRIIPLHERILPLIKKRYNAENSFLITGEKGVVHYYTYKDDYWDKLMLNLIMEHLPHDCRHTFASLADSYGMNKLVRKRIMGHVSADITDDIYTHKELEELLREVNKIP